MNSKKTPDFIGLPRPLVAGVGLVAATLFCASLAWVLSPAKGTPPAKAAETMLEGTTIVPKTVRTIDLYPKAPDRLPAPVVTPVKVATAAPVEPQEPALPVEHRRHYRHMADNEDICARHHMHKVVIGRGWRCRR